MAAAAPVDGAPGGPAGPQASAETGLSFFRGYNRTIGVAYGLLLLALGGFFAWQLQRSFGDEVAFLRGQIERHGQFLEFVLRSSTDQIESLRLAASAERESGRACRTGRQEAQAGELREALNGFHRDAALHPDAGGNLVGFGRLRGRSDDFYCDLGSALALSGQLHALAFHLPHAARVRFIATDAFHLVFPWQPSEQVPFDPAMYRDSVWNLAQAPVNPDRQKFWAPPFFGGEAVGLLAPVAAPVHGGGRLIGVVAIDMSLDYLNRVNGNFGYPLGTVSVVDATGHVLAHPQAYAQPLGVRAAVSLEHAVPAQLLPTAEALARLPAGEPVERAGWIVVRRPFVSAPWNLVYAVPRQALWAKLLAERAPAMGGALLAVALLMAVTYALTRREFVGPAARLVDHVAAESRLRAPAIPRVPAAWRPWFEAVSKAFRESVQLGSLRKELDIAARLQQAILPRQWPQDSRYSLWGSMQPAREIGGDFYDHFSLVDGRRGLVVADVSGKGISAGLFGMVSKTALRSQATHRALGPAAALSEVNEALCVDNESAMFVTTFYAQYEPATGELRYANAGHPPPLLVRGDGVQEWLARADGPALGVVEGATYGERSVRLAPGDFILFFTDGVNEAMNQAGQDFGLARVTEAFAGAYSASAARDAVDRLLAAVSAFAADAEQADDITCLALYCHGHGLPGAVS